jgi:hypothetical protein
MYLLLVCTRITKPPRKVVQLNEYETDPYFLQLSPNMATECFFTFVFFPVLAWIYLFCAKKYFVDVQNNFQVRTGKNVKVNKQSLLIFWLNWRKYGAVNKFFCLSVFIFLYVFFCYMPCRNGWNLLFSELEK